MPFMLSMIDTLHRHTVTIGRMIFAMFAIAAYLVCAESKIENSDFQITWLGSLPSPMEVLFPLGICSLQFWQRLDM